MSRNKKIPVQADATAQHLLAILDSSDDAIIGATPKGIITSWNAAAEKMYGYKSREVTGSPLSIILPRDHARDLARILARVRKGEKIDHVEIASIGKEGQHIDISLTISPIVQDAGSVANVIVLARDITRRLRGRDALVKRNRELLTFHTLSEIVLSPRSLEESYHDIVEEICAATSFPIAAIALFDEERQVIVFRGLKGYPNQPDGRLLEIPVDKTMSGIVVRTGKPLIEIGLREQPKYRSRLMRSMDAQTFIGYPMRVGRKIIGCLNLAHTESVEVTENTTRWIESLANYVAVLTERKRAEEELRVSREQLRELSKETQSAIEEERRRIALEIHDQLGQELSLFQLELGIMQDQLPRSEKDLRHKVNSMSKLVDASIRTVQRISADLRPTLLDNLGLGAAVEWAVKEFQKRTGIRSRASLEPAEIKLDQERSTALFRILQEALTNVLRHAKATAVDVELEKRDDAILLKVRDNGMGIQANRITDSKSVGLTGMRERVHPWGGSVTITGKPRRGTEIIISVPV